MYWERFWWHLKNGKVYVPDPFVHGSYRLYSLWMAVGLLTLVIGLVVGVALVLSSKRRDESE